MSYKIVSNNLCASVKVRDISRGLFLIILKGNFDFKCAFLKFHSALELNFITMYVMVYYNDNKLILTFIFSFILIVN
jgi:hypothetical protein